MNVLLAAQQCVKDGQIPSIAGDQDEGVDVGELAILENVANSVAELQIGVVASRQVVVDLEAQLQILLDLTDWQPLPVGDHQRRFDPAELLGGVAQTRGQ